MTPQRSRKRHPPDLARTGFTLIELLAVVVTIAMITSMVLPALAKTNTKSQAAQCLNNQKELALGWTLYASDNNRICRTAGLDSLVSSVSPTKNYPLNQWCMGTMNSGPSWTNQVLVMDSLLFKFVNDVDVYHCPADVSSVKNEMLNRYGGEGVLRARSVSMNCWMNPINGWTGDTRLGLHPVKNFRNVSDVLKPSTTFVTIDENPASINDAWFICDPATSTWIDIPATYHNGAGNLSFADGHSEMKKWTDPVLHNRNVDIFAVPQDKKVDLRWLQDRSTY